MHHQTENLATHKPAPLHLTRRRFLSTATLAGLGILGSVEAALAAGDPVKVRLGTLAPKGSSYCKHLQVMGEKWRALPAGGVALTIYPDGTMGSEADTVRRMRLGQLQASLLTAEGLSEIEPAVNGLQCLPMMFRSLDEVDYVGEKLQPLLEKRLEAKGFVALFWSDTGWVRFFSKKAVIRADDLRSSKLFVWAGTTSEADIYRSVGCNPVSLETMDILPSLQTGMINAVPLPPTYALAAQVDLAAPHMLELNWVPLVGALVITKKTWEAIPAESREAMRQAALEAGRLIKAGGRREAVESVEAMRKRGLQVHPVTPEIEADWRKESEAIYQKIRGTVVPADIFDLVTNELAAYRKRQQPETK
jgi:TRAP-type C4-dicarboxylate transport system substrate-binding protein